MRARFILYMVFVLVLSACASMGEEENPRINNKTAAQANTQLGIMHMREGNYDVARLKLEKALELQPDRVDAHEAIAILFAQVGEAGLAEKHYKKSLQINPKYARGHNNYGQFLCAQGHYKKAEKEFLLAANNPFYDFPSLPLTNAGLCAKRVPDMVKAEEYFRLALKKNPAFAPALLQMALISYSKGNYMSVRGYMQRLQEVTKHSPESLWLAIRTEYALDDHEAWRNYAVLLKNNFPESDETRSLQEWENERYNRE
jgi:type IV pilus assembly protein PilF